MLKMPASNDSAAVLAAISRAFAMIEFDPTGQILTANDSFCNLVGYSVGEIRGRHHSMFIDAGYSQSGEYRAFWTSLGQGQFQAGEFKRLGKGGQEVWIQASYTPVLDKRGRVAKVVKVALDVTASKLKAAEDAGKLDAILRAQAVIEFTTDGEILRANDNFLATVGYSRDEVLGRRHSLFVDPAYGSSPEYRVFWDRLRAGEYIADEFCRIGKGGRAIWLQASYNPIFDLNGKVMKVVKFATDVTERVAGVAAVADGLSKLASGELRHRIDKPLIPSLDKLRVDYNEALGKLQEAMQSITDNVRSMRTGTGEISQAADDLSKRTEQQAATLEETAAAMDEITATVRKTAEGATEANKVVAVARADAEKSGIVVRDAVSAMGEIEASAQKISQIIGVIDEIAFQTNLLALNAGVEAARAGDAGRGFAVVASEVRALAQRSAEAAKEIKALISASTQQVGQGVDLVGQTGKALERIVVKVSEISTLVSDITASAQEQATGLAQVNTAVNQMDQVTQQNAAMVEQSTAASHALAQEASELTRLVARFRTGAEEAEAPQRGYSPMRRPAQPARRLSAVAMKPTQQAAPQAADENWEEF